MFLVQYPMNVDLPEFFTAVSIAGNVKLLSSILKYIPLCWNNYKLKSTSGFNVFGAIADFIGGTCNMFQLFFDIWKIEGVVNPFTSEKFNPVKFANGALALGFNILFFAQFFMY